MNATHSNPPTAPNPSAQLRAKLGQWKWPIIGVAAGWFVFAVVLALCFPKGLERLGQVGDSMAFIGVCATALALGIGAYGLLLQREDIDAQIKEMAATAEATRDQVKAQRQDTRTRCVEALIAQLRRSVDSMDKVLDLADLHLREAQSFESTPGNSQATLFRTVLSPASTAHAIRERNTRLLDQRNMLASQLLDVEEELTAELVGQRTVDLPTLANRISAVRSQWTAFVTEQNTVGSNPPPPESP